ncbi:MAG: hypothetical protein H0U67_09280, partial [Gemmatimonadetes bacterium]|nr:hypothetical protein [Gemmatimonadota bacterium]
THVLNSLSPIASNSIFLSGGLFSMLESPVDLRGMLGGVDGRLASSGFLASLFPAFNQAELELFAKAQVEDGRIPRYIGNLHGGYTDLDPKLLGAEWTDATSAWILQVAHQYQSSGNTAFLGRLWPGIIRAVDYLVAQDPDGDGIPVEGSSLEDVAPGGSGAAYASGLYASAMRAAVKLAEAQGDAVRAGAWRERSNRADAGAVQIVARYSSDGTTVTNAAALAGDWAARAAGIPSPWPDDTAGAALHALYQRHVQAFPGPAIPMEAPANGESLPGDTSSLPALMDSYLAGAALQLGFPDQGMDILSRSYKVLYEVSRNAWHQSRRYNAPEGNRARSRQHRTASAAWNALPALAGFALDLPAGRLLLDPKVPTALEGRLHVPIFTPRFWAWLDYDASASTGTLSILRTFESEGSTAPVTITRVGRRLAHDGSVTGESELEPPAEFHEGASFNLDFHGGRLRLSLILPPEPEAEETTSTLDLDDLTTAVDELTSTSVEEVFDPEADPDAPVPTSSPEETSAVEEEHVVAPPVPESTPASAETDIEEDEESADSEVEALEETEAREETEREDDVTTAVLSVMPEETPSQRAPLRRR